MSIDPEQLETYAQTAETAMDLLQALEHVQLRAVQRNEWFTLRLKSHELAVLRDTYWRLAELRAWLLNEAAEKEMGCQELIR